MAQPSPEQLAELYRKRNDLRGDLPLRVRNSRYLNPDCIECHKERFSIGSRYCRRCFKYYAAKEFEDIKSGKAKLPNYGYSDSGWNNGLNAWVHDKDHFTKLERIAIIEGTVSIG